MRQMSKAIVLGNGPALDDPTTWSEDNESRFRIGVNRSFDILWAPIGVTADETFNLGANKNLRFQPMAWLFREDFVDAPYWTKCSGAFGLWVAYKMGFRDIKLVGFGGKGHFYFKAKSENEFVTRGREENDRKLWQGIKELAALDSDIRITGILPEPPDRPVYGRMRAI